MQKAKDHFGLSKIAETLGESLTGTKRLVKLNDLIPEIQSLVSSGSGAESVSQNAQLKTTFRTNALQRGGAEDELNYDTYHNCGAEV